MTASQKMPRNARGVGSSCKRSGRFGLLIIADFAISKRLVPGFFFVEGCLQQLGCIIQAKLVGPCFRVP